jgi:CoA:oxalate CoA-transferase
LEAHDVPVAPLYNIAEALADPQVAHLGLFDEVQHPAAGNMRFVGGPVHYDDQMTEPSVAPPLLGEHSAALLRELGCDGETVRQLEEKGIVRLGDG